MTTFKKAVKYGAKARVALIGPAGAGKSYTMLQLARQLAIGGKIAAVDTERGSLSKYADLFGFDVIEPSEYTPEVFLTSLTAAEEAGYAVFCCDSLSHFWIGKGGALEWVDMASKQNAARGNRDGMSGWKDFSPVEREMMDRMTASPCHVIVTMRTKTEYQETTDAQGKKKRVKIGLAPVQRAGLEYEFDLVGYMDDENNFITDKTRCPAMTGKVLAKPGDKEFAPFVQWLEGAVRKLADEELAGHLEAIRKSATMESLQGAYSTAIKAADTVKDKFATEQIVAAKDKRKTELSQPKEAA